MPYHRLLPLILGFCLDLVAGDPTWLPHPIVAIGKLVSIMERGLRRLFPTTSKGEFVAGTVLAVFVPVCVCGVSWGILRLCLLVSPILAFIVESFMCYQLLATKSLHDESMRVYREVRTGDINRARAAVSRIVGRDTDALSMEGVIKATVETVAENTSDGIVVPLCFMAIGGAPLCFLYKAINTLDSMVGYKNDAYLYFGRISARLDDVANYLPARLSALLMILGAGFVRLDVRNSWRIWRRDRRNHSSPNSAQTESVCAGALNVQLAGDAWYFGKLVHKPTIGDASRTVEVEDIRRANQLLYATAILAVVLLSACIVAVHIGATVALEGVICS